VKRRSSALIVLICSFPLLGQQPSLTEIIQIPSTSNLFGQQIAASPNRRTFVLYAEAVEESPSGLLNTLVVVHTDGPPVSPKAAVPGLVATVADDGTVWSAGYFSASDQSQGRVTLARIDPQGNVSWTQTIDASPAAMALDSAGHLILAGSATPGSGFANVSSGAPGPLAFLAFLDQNTGATVSVQTLGGTTCQTADCGGYGSPRTSAGALAIFPDGSIWVAGFTNTRDLPVTSGALHAQPTAPGSWLAHFTASGSAVYASYLLGMNDTPLSIAPGPDSAVYLASRVAGATSYSTAFAKLDPAASKIVYSPIQPWNTGPLTLGVDANGNLLGAYGYYVTNIFWFAPDGTLGGKINYPGGLLSIAAAAGDSIYGLSTPQPPLNDPLAQDFLYHWTLQASAGPTVLHLASSAGSVLIERAAPGELVSFYGSALGPAPGLTSTFDSHGLLPVDFGGTEVFFDGKHAPLLYVSDSQVNAIVPFSVAGQQTTAVQVCTSSCTPPVQVRVAPAHPNLFTLADPPFTSRVLTFATDGVLNTSVDPARPGSVVTMFLTGAGAVTEPPTDGAVGVPFQGQPQLPVHVTVGTQDATVLYAGSSAGAVTGVLQLNIKLPDLDAGAVVRSPISVSVGDSTTSSYIYLWNGGHS
jgi:uncharacterized protein (TIGR03437 family)